MKRLSALIAGLIFITAVDCFAFDGNRKGFVLGGGIGITPAAHYTIGSDDDTKAGLAADILIGYAWNEQNMIVYQGNGTAYYLNGRPGNEDIDIIQQYNGFSWYHYFGPRGKALFALAGIGVYSFRMEDGPDTDPGAAGLLGGGYEFTPHVQVGAYFSGGRTTYRDDDGGNFHLSVILSAIAF